jgi:hypothetical protein
MSIACLLEWEAVGQPGFEKPLISLPRKGFGAGEFFTPYLQMLAVSATRIGFPD